MGAAAPALASCGTSAALQDSFDSRVDIFPHYNAVSGVSMSGFKLQPVVELVTMAGHLVLCEVFGLFIRSLCVASCPPKCNHS